MLFYSSAWMKDKSFQLHLDGIGPVCFHSSLRARRLGISVIPFQGVRVSVPAGMSLTRAAQAVSLRKTWIAKNLARTAEVERKCEILLRQAGPVDLQDGRQRLIFRTHKLAEKYNFSFNRIFIRRQRSRWGSCSAANNISLNIKIIYLPRELGDFIIIHELVHTKVKNHGQKFWDKLEEIVPQARILNRQLKLYSGLLFLS